MCEKKSELRLIGNGEKVLCSIAVEIFYNEENEFDEGDVFFIHPMTGSQCDTLDLCFVGWSEFDEESKNQWNNLRKQIENDSDLFQKLDYGMDKIDYYYIKEITIGEVIKEVIKNDKTAHYEIYRGKITDLHTDRIEFVMSDYSSNEDKEQREKILAMSEFDYCVMDKEEYEHTIYANCSNETEEEDFPILIIVIN